MGLNQIMKSSGEQADVTHATPMIIVRPPRDLGVDQNVKLSGHLAAHLSPPAWRPSERYRVP